MKIYLPSVFEPGYRLIAVLTVLMIFTIRLSAGTHTYTDGWGKAGFTIQSQSSTSVVINYSVGEFSLSDVTINGEVCQNLEMPGSWLPGDEGTPMLPASGRYLALPQGAKATFRIVSFRTETFPDVNLMPSFRIPRSDYQGSLEYTKDAGIYSADKFFPEKPVKLMENGIVRGVDVVMLGVTPFMYNPVTKELIVYRDLNIEVTFDGGNGHFGDDRLRSRWWDPMLSDLLLNYASLPEMNYNKSFNTDETGCDYLVIIPNESEFQQWADSVKDFRNSQGILTMVVTLQEIGGNTAAQIEGYIDNAYNTWDIPPSACLLLGDYGTDASNRIISPLWNNYCVSDNIYGDVNNDDLPDIVMARITAQDEVHLQVMVTKFIHYEKAPPTDPDFYLHPVTSTGWATDGWFQLGVELPGGFWREVLGKQPVRINEIVSGTPGTIWSSADNTGTIVNYFGPDGLDYIPEYPSDLGGWTNGTPDAITTAVNNGTFMIQQCDHGTESGWLTPEYSILNINSLLNTDLTFVWSIDDLTGKFNYSSEVFAEKFHRYTHKDENSGCFGINAASEITYEFVNEVYVWGAYDNMWPNFMPEFGSTPEPRGILPAFACAAGKYFLQQSMWSSNQAGKTATFHLFHHHGDAFTTVYSEVPQNLTVSHQPYLYTDETTFEVTVDPDALIGLSVNGVLIGTATGTGNPVAITIPAQAPPDQVLVTVTKQNYYRYEGYVDVLPATGPYVVQNSVALNDGSGNGNGIMETSESILASITVENVGVEDATNVTVTIATADAYITLTDNTESYGTIPAGSTAVVTDGFAWVVSDNIPDMHNVIFELTATDGTMTWLSDFSITGHAPLIETGNLLIDDYIGNFNGRLDPGETVFLIIPTYNNGSYNAANTIGTLSCSSGYITLINTTYNFNDIGAGLMEEAMFNVTVSANAPAGSYVEFLYEVTSGAYYHQESYPTIISMIVEDWETGDMSLFDWTTGGDSDWIVSTDTPYEGSFCIKSGPLTDDESNYLSLEYEVLGEDSLSFWYKVSSETGYDFMKFYIDDVEISSWTGEIDWARASYLITVGTHTFKWIYIKDETLSGGNDCSWLDFIVFPVAVFEAAFISDATDICEGESVSFFDQSPASAISWDWIFEGGTPGTSSLQNPVIEYLTSGVFDVSLTVSNGTVTNTLLLEDYITVSALPETAPTPTGPTAVCGDTEYTDYNTSGLTGITVYNWLLEPVDAGNVTGTGFTVTVNWTTGFLGEATLMVAGENNCGSGAYSEPVIITRYLPEVTLEPFNWVCLDWPAFELTGGMPVGGEYSGPGVENGWFYPSLAGTGTHTITYTYTDPNSCDNFATETILVDPCTGVNVSDVEPAITIYPNPTKGIITLDFNLNTDKTEVLVLNMLNKVVYSDLFETISAGKVNIDLSNLPGGIYFIKLKTDKKEVTQKVILK